MSGYFAGIITIHFGERTVIMRGISTTSSYESSAPLLLVLTPTNAIVRNQVAQHSSLDNQFESDLQRDRRVIVGECYQMRNKRGISAGNNYPICDDQLRIFLVSVLYSSTCGWSNAFTFMSCANNIISIIFICINAPIECSSTASSSICMWGSPWLA